MQLGVFIIIKWLKFGIKQQTETDKALAAFENTNSSLFGHILVTTEGVPFKFNINISKSEAIRYTGLLFNLMNYVKKVLDDLKRPEMHNQKESVRNNFLMRLRLNTGMEIIVNQESDYYLISLQQCKIEEKKEDK